MMRVGLLGAGFIGKVHASSVFRSEFGTLASVYDVRDEAARELAVKYGTAIAATLLLNEHRPVKNEYTI